MNKSHDNSKIQRDKSTPSQNNTGITGINVLNEDSVINNNNNISKINISSNIIKYSSNPISKIEESKANILPPIEVMFEDKTPSGLDREKFTKIYKQFEKIKNKRELLKKEKEKLKKDQSEFKQKQESIILLIKQMSEKMRLH